MLIEAMRRAPAAAAILPRCTKIEGEHDQRARRRVGNQLLSPAQIVDNEPLDFEARALRCPFRRLDLGSAEALVR